MPAAAARNVARNAGGMFWYALGAAVISAISGLALSYSFDTATGATVILVASALFALTYPLKLMLK